MNVLRQHEFYSAHSLPEVAVLQVLVSPWTAQTLESILCSDLWHMTAAHFSQGLQLCQTLVVPRYHLHLPWVLPGKRSSVIFEIQRPILSHTLRHEPHAKDWGTAVQCTQCHFKLSSNLCAVMSCNLGTAGASQDIIQCKYHIKFERLKEKLLMKAWSSLAHHFSVRLDQQRVKTETPTALCLHIVIYKGLNSIWINICDMFMVCNLWITPPCSDMPLAARNTLEHQGPAAFCSNTPCIQWESKKRTSRDFSSGMSRGPLLLCCDNARQFSRALTRAVKYSLVIRASFKPSSSEVINSSAPSLSAFCLSLYRLCASLFLALTMPPGIATPAPIMLPSRHWRLILTSSQEFNSFDQQHLCE